MTIICVETGYYISDHLYHDPLYAFRYDRRGWIWLGSIGWYYDEFTKGLHNWVLRLYPDLHKMWDGEYVEIF